MDRHTGRSGQEGSSQSCAKTYDAIFFRCIMFAVFADCPETAKIKLTVYYVIYYKPLICENVFRETHHITRSAKIVCLKKFGATWYITCI